MQYWTLRLRSLLGTEQHSAGGDACAAATSASGKAISRKATRANTRRGDSLISQSLHRVEARGSRGGVHSRCEADEYRESDRGSDHPPRHGCDADRGKIAAGEINIGAKVNRMADKPADRHSADSAEQSHGARFDEEEAAHVAVCRAQRFEDADLAAALKDCHHQRVDDAERGDHEREAPENPEE